MGQSNAIFGALLFAFIVFITAKGELGTYIQLLLGGGAQGSTGVSGPSTAANPFPSLFGSDNPLIPQSGDQTFDNNGNILGSGGNVESLLNGGGNDN